MNQHLLVQEFLDEISQRAEKNFKSRLHEAFLSWYIQAEFGKVKWEFTDNANDGGIDAVVWRPDDIPPVVLIQSKFTEHVGKTSLPRGVYRDLKNVVEAFRHGGEAFDTFIAVVRDDLRRTYRRACDRLADLKNWNNGKKAFRLVTTFNRRTGAEFDTIPEDNFIYADEILRLYEQFRKGATPKARQLQLTLDDKLRYKDRRRGVTSYLFNAKLSDFRRYLDHNDVARLVARNIRYNLGGKIGRDIRNTYEKQPFDFWYVHNGLSIICDDFFEKDQVATLINPSVVNGAQTLYAISGSSRKNSPALVTTRVVVRGNDRHITLEDDDWVQRVIRGVNTQNRVRTYDLRSNEPEQVELQNKFRDLKVFYERKRGEWRELRNEPRYRDFSRVSLRTLGQILTAISDKDGKGVLLVKRGVETIFDDKPYHRLFPSRAKIARRFERIYLAYRVYRLLELYGYRDAREYRKQRHAFWNTLWLLHRGITSVYRLHSRCDLRSIRNAFDSFESDGKWGRNAKKLVKQTRNAVWSAWRKARSADPERWTPPNFFKAKFGNRKVLKVAFPKVRGGLRSLGEHMTKSRR